MDEGIKIISRCPVCHYNYNPVEAKVLEENDLAHLIYIKCRRCRSAILALIMTSGYGISSVGLVTDLDSHEVNQIKELSVVSGEDVLSVFKALEHDQLDDIIK
ncbi:MAG TPA: hypothetical protein VJB67_02790 [Patescibacteria group bacterium]|nr:hypothetical protein [Patescibacteria group bacterium]